ncbi:hypothetical protein D3C78_1302360 [compost metagenome]
MVTGDQPADGVELAGWLLRVGAIAQLGGQRLDRCVGGKRPLPILLLPYPVHKGGDRQLAADGEQGIQLGAQPQQGGGLIAQGMAAVLGSFGQGGQPTGRLGHDARDLTGDGLGLLANGGKRGGQHQSCMAPAHAASAGVVGHCSTSGHSAVEARA